MTEIQQTDSHLQQLRPSQEEPAHNRARGAFGLATIRSRLLLAFIVLVVLPAGIITTVSSIQGTNEAEQRVIAQLESVATLKEPEIQTWLDSQQDDLFSILANRDASINMRTLIELEPDDLLRQSAVRSQLRNRLQNFDELFLINQEGVAFLSTEQSQFTVAGRDFSDDPLFETGMEGPFAQVKLDFPSPGDISVVVARPIPSLQGDRLGIIAGHTSLENLSLIMEERAGLGDTGETYLVSPENVLLTRSRFEGYPIGETAVSTIGADKALNEQLDGAGTYEGYRGSSVIGVYRWLPYLHVALLAEQDQSEALAATWSTLQLNLVVTVGCAMLATLVGLVVTRGIANPLTNLTETATRIAAGNLELETTIERRDEIGTLAKAFTSMTAQLRRSISDLEKRVDQRTAEHAYRSQLLEAAAQVTQQISLIQDAEQMTERAVHLVSQQFHHYHAAIFLLNETREYAVLKAASSEGGRRMLDRSHKLKVGKVGVVGKVAAEGKAHVAEDVQADDVYFDNPDMPYTRSELALPLRLRGEVIGVLDIQSEEEGAFGPGNIAIYQTLADQIAISINNAQLFQQVQQSLETERRSFGEMSRLAWRQLLFGRTDLQERYDPDQILPRNGEWRDEMLQAAHEGKTALGQDRNRTSLAIPIKAHDEIIGVINAHKPVDAGGWTSEEISLIETLTGQLNVALESARLYEETRRRAAREQLTSEVTTRMRETLDVDAVIKVAVQEMRQALGAAKVEMRMGTPDTLPSE